ncbi:hypothetical protein A11Q_2214 [Pseudobdellovibrio exovorus JSS]|uniref:Uncharacterized protein n=1 Tax=Pseudobdellovibrio exovorus JSS TaxID=1184267 RepID=M4VD63_9BACT|nr:hypothetical protein A11Q_2214 [Pseudobdellovibrio exovorus JSS]
MNEVFGEALVGSFAELDRGLVRVGLTKASDKVKMYLYENASLGIIR